MDEQWTSVATFSWYQDALLLKMRLEANGIPCMIPEQYSSTIDPGITGMTVRVLVQGQNFEEAKALIESSALQEEPETCPNCGSTEIETHGRPKTNLLRFIMGFLMFSPMRRKTHKICAKCKTEV